MFCKKCGTSNPDGARFCKGCGADLSAQAAAPAPAPAAPVYPGYAAAPAAPVPAESLGRKKWPVAAAVMFFIAATLELLCLLASLSFSGTSFGMLSRAVGNLFTPSRLGGLLLVVCYLGAAILCLTTRRRFSWLLAIPFLVAICWTLYSIFTQFQRSELRWLYEDEAYQIFLVASVLADILLVLAALFLSLQSFLPRGNTAFAVLYLVLFLVALPLLGALDVLYCAFVVYTFDSFSFYTSMSDTSSLLVGLTAIGALARLFFLIGYAILGFALRGRHRG